MRGLVESRFRPGRQNQQVRSAGVGRYLRFGRFLEDDMRVRSAHTGGHHSCSSGTVAGPIPQLRVYVERGARKIDFGIGLAEVQTRRKLSVLEGKNGLYDAGDCRRGVQMPHIGFYRTDGAVARTLRRGTERRSEERRVGKECRSRWSPYH